MNWKAKYREKRIWKQISQDLAALNQRLTIARVRQMHREAQLLRLTTPRPLAIAELRQSTDQLEAKMLADWLKSVQTPAIVSHRVVAEPLNFPPPLLTYAFKFPESYSSAEWKKAVESSGFDYQTALYAVETLELKLRYKQSGLTAEDKKSIREAIRSLLLRARAIQDEHFRNERAASVEAATYEANMERRVEVAASETAGEKQCESLFDVLRELVNRRHSGLRDSLSTIHEIVDGSTPRALQMTFLGRNRNQLLLVVTRNGRIRWEWQLKDGDQPWVRTEDYYKGIENDKLLGDLAGFERAIDWTNDLLNERIVVMSAIDVDGMRFEALSREELASADYQVGSVCTVIRSWNGKYDQDFGLSGS